VKTVDAAPLQQPEHGSEPEAVDHDDRLILWMLELTPEKRLEALQNFADGVAALQHARKVTE